ncbi:MAG: hypothetical protein ACLRQY_13655, partial [[Clostridium] leptum]
LEAGRYDPLPGLTRTAGFEGGCGSFFLFCGFYVLEHGKMPEICRAQGCLNAVLEHFLYFF